MCIMIFILETLYEGDLTNMLWFYTLNRRPKHYTLNHFRGFRVEPGPGIRRGWHAARSPCRAWSPK